MQRPAAHWFLLILLPMVTAFSNPADSTGGNKPMVHPFYVTVIEINHNASQSSLEISCKLFADDFETALKNQYKMKIDLQEQKSRQQSEKFIADYIQKNLQCKVNGKPVTLQFVGFEKESEAVWCYFEIKQVPAVKTMEVTNALLYESFQTQISIIHALVSGNRTSTKLVNPDKLATFQF